MRVNPGTVPRELAQEKGVHHSWGQSNGRPCAHAGLDSTKAQCVERHRLRQGEKCNLDCVELVRKTMQFRRRAAIESGLLVSTVGRDEDVFRKHIASQEQRDQEEGRQIGPNFM